MFWVLAIDTFRILSFSLSPGDLEHLRPTSKDFEPETSYGLFPLSDSDSDSDSGSDSKPYGYMVCRTYFHWLRFRLGSLSHSICIVQESESESESESGNGNKPLEMRVECRESTMYLSYYLVVSNTGAATIYIPAMNSVNGVLHVFLIHISVFIFLRHFHS